MLMRTDPVAGGRDLVPAGDLDRRDPPTMIAMQGRGKGPSFGLDRPLNLLGGRDLVADELAAHVVADWLPDLSDLVGESCHRQLAAGADWFRLPPLALCGGTKEEARFIARRIARMSGIPLLVMDAKRLQPQALLRTKARGPEFIAPPDPVIAMASSGCGNPLILVLGIEGASPRVAEGLAAMLDSQTGQRWLCQSMDAVLDLGALSWMVQTSHHHSLPTSLYSRLMPISIDVPADRHVGLLRVIAMAEEVIADNDLEVEEVRSVLATILDNPDGAWGTTPRCAAAELYETLTRQFLHAAHAPRF